MTTTIYPCDCCGKPLDNEGRGWTVYPTAGLYADGGPLAGMAACWCSDCADIDADGNSDGPSASDRLESLGFRVGRFGGNLLGWVRSLENGTGYTQVWDNKNWGLTLESGLTSDVIVATYLGDCEEASSLDTFPTFRHALRHLAGGYLAVLDLEDS